MPDFLETRRSFYWLLAGVAIGGTIFVLALSTLMLPYARVVEENSNQDLTCLQIPFTRERAVEIIDSYDRATRLAARSLHLPGDLIFPVGYALLYSGLLGLVARRQDEMWLRLGLLAMTFPFLAMMLDWVENFLIVSMLTVAMEERTDAIPGWMPLLGGVAGSLKYLFLSLLTPLYGLVAIARSLVRRDPALGAGLLLTYGIVAALLLFNLAQTVTQVPACLVDTF